MKTVVLVGCGAEKLPAPAKAKDLYTGPLFKKARAYAEKFGDEWRILSAKYGLLDPERVIEPYDLTLGQMDSKWYYSWGLCTRNAISCNLLNWTHDGHGQNFKCDPVRFVVLAGEPYTSCLRIEGCRIPKFCVIEKPLQGLGIGQRLKWLKDALEA